MVVVRGWGKEDLAEDFDRAAEDKMGLKAQCQLRYCLTGPPNMGRKHRPTGGWKNNVHSGEVLGV
jgi:hypothetical protein